MYGNWPDYSSVCRVDCSLSMGETVVILVLVSAVTLLVAAILWSVRCIIKWISKKLKEEKDE